MKFFPQKNHKIGNTCPLPTWQQFRQGKSSPYCPNPHHCGPAPIWLALCSSICTGWAYGPLSDLVDPCLRSVWIILPQHEGLGQGVKDGGPSLGLMSWASSK